MERIKIIKDGNECLSTCKHFTDIRIGSIKCKECKYNLGIVNNFVKCDK